MTKATATIAILLGLTLGASAQSNSGLFGRGPETEENDRNTPNGGLINLPGSHSSTDDADGPLGGGIALLTGLGTAYLVAKKRKNAQRGAMMALLALLAFGPTAWAQNGIYCTASDKNRVVCTDGTIYDNVAAATADGKTAAAKIIYIDEVNKKGLALALRDEGQYTQDGGITACNNKNTSMPVVGGTWKLASKSEWDKMISAAGSGPALFDGFSSVGGTDMLHYYWSSEIDESGVNGLIIQRLNGWSDFVSNSQYANIRACLTFNLLTLYEIGNQSEWNVFCTVVNLGNNFIDKYVKLTSDISVSEMAGFSEDFSFRGLFDGDGHTLTVSYNTGYTVTAPFRYVNNATIRNLKTTGTITTSAMCAAGIVGDVTGSLNLISCSSSVAISSSRGDIDTHGGLVASNGGNVTISGCVFDGSFAATVAHTNSYGTTFCGGIVGMCNENTSATITNSLVAPSSVSEGMINETFVGLYEGATVTIENCYFVATANLPSNQGTQVYYTAPANGIYKSITISGTTVYSDACSVSGVEAAYDLDQGLVFITPTVTDPFAATLTFGTDYTATMDGDAVLSLPVSISTAGNYTLVLTGAGSYTGTKTFNITATGDVVNSALTISSEEEWNTFAASVNNGNNYSDQFVKLTADISVSTMVGTSETNSFQGTFLGDGTHTLTFTKGTAESAFGEENCAPFRYVKNATIRDLKVTGDIYTSRKFAAGLVARNSGETNITNCQIGTVIHSSVSGDGTHGGIVAMPASGTTTNITGCVYNGRLLTTSSTTCCGGFVGWHGGATVSISNSLYAPSSIPTGWTTITDGATFVRGGSPTIDNCYYTATMGAAQGKASRTVTAGTDVTIQAVALTGTTTEYTVSGITAYSGGGLQRGGTLYYGSGDQLSLTLTNTATAPDSYRYDGYNASAGTLSGSDADGWILLMPDEDVTISLGPLAPIDWATQSTGDADHPYLIYNKDQLDLLAHRVNGTHGETANDYSGKHFRLEADITYDHTGLGDTDSNYEAIGYYYGYDNNRNFRGTFDGDGHTVSGIRIYKGGTDYADRFQGLFGRIGNGAEVKNVILADARITGYNSTGAIVGYNDPGGTVTDCHALADVTVHAVQSNVCYHGGIAGFNEEGTVTRCTSAAALTTAGSNSRYFGGIAGYSSYGTVTDCIYLGTTLEGASYVGAIVGSNYGTGTVETSYFTNTAIQGKDNNGTTLGNAASAVSYNNGGTIANSGLAHTVTLGESVTLGDTPTGEGRVKAYGDYALSYSDGTETTLYSTAGSTIALAYSAPDGYTFDGFTVNGAPISGSTFTMPDEDVTVSVNLIPYFTRTVDGYGEGDGGWVFIASPVEGSIETSAVGNIFSATEYDLYRFNPSADLEWENWKQEGNHHHFNLENGRGYLYATKETKTLVFSGSFNMNDTKTIESLPAGFNLVGNPFTTDAYIDKPYYTLNGDGSAILTTTSEDAIAPCHGVIVELDVNESVTFSKTAPAATANQGLLNITVSEQKADTRGASTGSATAIDNAIVRFGEGQQLGKFHFGNPSANISIPQGGKEYAVANVNVGTDVARNVSTNEMPVNFKASKNGEYTISVNPENVELDYLHLIDNLTGSDVDLLALRQAQGPASYTFTAKATDYASRFRLVFSASGDACEPSGNFAFISNGNIIVNGEGTLQVVDVTGRVVRCSDGVHTVSTNGMTPGIYVLRLIEGNNVRIQKIVIE